MPGVTREPGLARETAGGILWLSLAGVLTQAIGFVSGVVVARYLGEDDYGTAAMAMVVISMGNVFLGFGLAPAIISGRISDAPTILSAHWFLALAALVMAGLVAATGPPVAGFFDNPRVPPLMVVASMIVLLGSWEVIPLAVLQAARRFRRMAQITVAGQLVLSASAIALAVLGAGVWALVVPYLLQAVVRAGAATICSPVRLRPRLVLREVRPHLREFLHVTGTSLTDYFFFNSDRIVIGRILGTAPLGRYSFAHALVSRSLYSFSRTFAAPLLAALGHLRDDLPRFDRAVVRSTLAVARIAFPLAAGGAVVADSLVRTLVGESWGSAVTLVQVFFLLGAVQAIGQLSGPVWLALGKTRLVLSWSAVTNSVLVGIFLLGAATGSSEGVAIAFTLYSALVVAPACCWVTRRFCGIPLHGLGRGLLAVLRDVLGMVVVIVVLDRLLARTEIHEWARLSLQIVAGAVVYGLFFRWISRAELSSLLSVVPEPARRIACTVFRLEESA